MKKKIVIVLLALISIIVILLGANQFSQRIKLNEKEQSGTVQDYSSSDYNKSFSINADVLENDWGRGDANLFCINYNNYYYSTQKFKIIGYYDLKVNGDISGKGRKLTDADFYKMIYIRAKNGNNSRSTNDKYQQAIWKVMDSSSKAKGYGYSGFNQYNRAYSSAANTLYNEANAYASYISKTKANPPKNVTTSANIKQKTVNGKIVIGPYKIQYTSNKTYGFGRISTATLAGKTVGTDWYFSDANGNKKSTYPESGSNFYLTINPSKINITNGVKLKFTFQKAGITGKIAILENTSGGYGSLNQDLGYVAGAKYASSTKELITVKGKVEPDESYYNISIVKKDKDTKEVLPGTEFKIYGYDSKSNTYPDLIDTVYTDENGKTSPFQIKVEKAGNYAYRYKFVESEAPDGYNQNPIDVYVYLFVDIQNNKYTVKQVNNVVKFNGIYEEDKVTIKTANTKEYTVDYGTSYNKGNVAVTTNIGAKASTITFTDTKIAPGNYSFNINKKEDNGNTLSGAKFRISASSENTSTNWTVLNSATMPMVNSNSTTKHDIGNNQVSIQTGYGYKKVDLVINNITDDMYFKIEEVTAPEDYERVKKVLIVHLNFGIENGRYVVKGISFEDENGNTIKDLSQYSNLITFDSQSNVLTYQNIKSMPTSYTVNLEKIGQQISGNSVTNTMLDNVTFKIYREDYTNSGEQTDYQEAMTTNGGKLSFQLDNIKHINPTYFIEEVSAPAGYIYSPGRIQVTLSTSSNNGVVSVTGVTVVNHTYNAIKVNDQRVSYNTNIQLSGDVNLKIEVINVKEEQGFTLGLKKVGTENLYETDGIALSGVKFDIYESKDGQLTLVDRVTTNKDNISITTALSKAIDEDDKLESNTYVIKESQTISGYKPWGEDEYIQIRVDRINKEDGTWGIYRIEIMNNVNNHIKVTNTSSDQPIDRIIEKGQTTQYNLLGEDNIKYEDIFLEITMPNVKIKQGTYNLQIEKVDAKDTNIRLDGVKFDIVNNGNQSILGGNYLTTDSNGQIRYTLSLNSEGTIEYRIKEKATKDGYVLLGENEYISVKLTVAINASGVYEVSAVQITNYLQTYDNKAGVTVNNQDTIQLKQINRIGDKIEEPHVYGNPYDIEKSSVIINMDSGITDIKIKIPNQPTIKNSNFRLKMMKVDSKDNDKKLAGVEFGLYKNDEYITTLTTNGNGEISYDIPLTQKEYNLGSVVYRLKELTTNDDYILLDNYIDFILTIDEKDGNYVATKVETTNTTSLNVQSSLYNEDGVIVNQVELQTDEQNTYENTTDKIVNVLELIIPNEKQPGLTADIGGTVWLDVPPDETKPEGNQILDDSEKDYSKILNGVTVELYEVMNGNETRIKTTTPNNDGSYIFTELEKQQGATYYVKFLYDGMNYTTVTKNYSGDRAKDSKADEIGRTDFNQQFAMINSNSGIEYTTTSNDSTKKLVSKYNYNDKMVISARTDDINWENDADYLMCYHLGLKQRPTFDMALYKYVDHATVKVNGQEQIYEYDKYNSYNPQTQTYDEFMYGIRNEDYELGVRQSDRTDVAGLEASITYKLDIINQSNPFGYISKLTDYYDSTYTLDTIEVKNNNNQTVDVDLNVIRDESQTITANEKNYHKMEIQITKKGNNTILGNNEHLYLYVTLKFKDPVNSLASITDTEGLRTMNFVEITEYQTFDSKEANTTPGLIDIDSAPGNFDITKYKQGDYLEDDTDHAPSIIYKNKEGRSMEGSMFEDIDTKVNIKGATVELIETDSNGTPIYEQNGTYRELTHKVTTTDEKGNYQFKDYLPGYYMVRFHYGDRDSTLLTKQNGGLHDTSYNGQDYASTDYDVNAYTQSDWYLSVTNKSDATDNERRRQQVNQYSQEFTNYKAEVLNSWQLSKEEIENNTNGAKDKVEALKSNTNMIADTAKLQAFIEYSNGKVTSNKNVPYRIQGIDFGIKKRPESNLKMIKQVNKVTVLSSSGDTLIEDALEVARKQSIWIENSEDLEGIIKAELEDTLINGATIKIEYKITVENIGNYFVTPMQIVDYIDNGLRFDDQSTSEWEITDKKALQTDNPQTSLVNNSIKTLDKYQTMIKATQTNPLVQQLAPGQQASSYLTLTKTMTTSSSTEDDLSYRNVIEILKTYNEQGRKNENSIPGDLDPEKAYTDPEESTLKQNDSAKAEPVTVSNPTGDTYYYYLLGFVVVGLLIVGIVLIKKYVIKIKD